MRKSNFHQILPNNDTRNELVNYALTLLYEQLYEMNMNNLSMFIDDDMFYNWYHGYTETKLPYHDVFYDPPRATYNLKTYAASGTISTENFGSEYIVDKVKSNSIFSFYVYPPLAAQFDSNVTLHLEVEQTTMKDLSSGMDRFICEMTRYYLDDKRYFYMNFTPPGLQRFVSFERKVSQEEIEKSNQERLPGFKIHWYYSGKEVKPDPKFSNKAKAFLRKNICIC